jgi:hypothetical protein
MDEDVCRDLRGLWMNDIATHSDSRRVPPTSAALQDVAEAGYWVAAAKRTHCVEQIERTERALQAAVDAARDRHVPWGEIGSALGIARGNAYQRYRKRQSPGVFGSESRTAAAYRNPSL